LFCTIIVWYSTVDCFQPFFMTLIEKIEETGKVLEFNKNDTIVIGITNAIEEGIISRGDNIPSVNQLSANLGYARETIVKAYSELKERGIINSKKGIGYFVENENTNQKLKIALVMYSFQNFQQVFYNSFRKALGENYQIDVFFHHNNFEIYKTILNQIQAKYGFYVIAPIQVEDAEKLLQGFSSEKLLIVDRFQHINNQVSYIAQEFKINLTNVLESLTDRIKEFSEFVFFYRKDADYPKELLVAFKDYCKKYQIKNTIYDEYDEQNLQKNTVYLAIGDNDLWELLKECKERGYVLGKDIGIISHNDSPEKEIIEGGITTFSTDFKSMAKQAADFVKNRIATKVILPSILIRRNSL
jgi:DNA-binding transcriptional regulator YhcF (GntR family)/sulfur transfer complex TusBCD TusB component (DsrH family)